MIKHDDCSISILKEDVIINSKKVIITLLLIFLLICCFSAVSANNTDNIDNLLNQNDQLAIEDIEKSNDDNTVSVSNEDNSLMKTNDDVVSSSSSSPYKKFVKDLEANGGVITLEDDIKISKVFTITEKTVIDGNGHTIDAQHKTVIFKTTAPLTLKNIKLINGNSKEWGGAIHAGGTLKLVNCVFKGNKAERGGAIFSSGTVTVEGCTFQKNKATEYGGAICIHRGKLIVKDSKFISNGIKTKKSSGYGGAIRLWLSKSNIQNSQFKSNFVLSKSLKSHSQATKYKFHGGAIAVTDGSKHQITKCSFSKNKASNHGGSIFTIGKPTLIIKNSKFQKNRACFEDGGAVSFSGKKITISKCTFVNNLAYEDGGAMDAYSVSSRNVVVKIKNSKFKSNTGYKCAGAIWLGVKTVSTLENDIFEKNKASSAGAVECEKGSSKFVKCKFIKNKAAKVTSWTVRTKSGGNLAHSGGAILVKNKCSVIKCKFKGNKAKWGKNIKVEGGKLTSK